MLPLPSTRRTDRPRWVWPWCIATLAVQACGGAEAPQADADPGATGVAEAVEEESAEPLRTVFTDRAPQPGPDLRPYLDEREGESRGWPEERRQSRARGVLLALLEQLMRGEEGDWASSLAPDFRSTELRPASLRVVHEQGGCVVRRPEDPTSLDPVSLRLDGEEALSALRDLTRAAGVGREGRVEVETLSTGMAADGALETRVLLLLSGSARGKRKQVTATCLARWSERDDEAPRLASLGLESYEEVSLLRPAFGDLTGFLLSSQPWFKGEILLGVDDYDLRRDRLCGPAFMGAQGAAVGDANGDGLDDVFVAQQAGVPNRLLLQLPDGRVQDVSLAAGVAFLETVRGALFVDLDNDGDQDLALALGPNVLVLWNDGGARFTDPVLLEGGGDDNVFSLCAADPDDDGDLDLYACHYIFNDGTVSTLPTPYHDANNGSANSYWRNEGGGAFTNATVEVGLDVNNRRFSLAAIWEDLDLDGDVDLYVTNDFGRNNYYRNDGGSFVDVAGRIGAADQASGMGATIADYDGDGLPDLYVSNMFMPEGMRAASGEAMLDAAHQRFARGNTLLRGREDGSFEDATLDGAAWRGGWTWGAVFGDFDNDGRADVYVPNGFLSGRGDDDVDAFHWRSVVSRSPEDGLMTEEYRAAWSALEYLVLQRGASYSGKERNCFYLNTGDGRFADISAASGADFLDDSRAACLVDWDDDGRLDLVLKNRTAPRLRVLRNQFPDAGSHLSIELVGVDCNRDAIGARVEVRAGGQHLRRSLRAGEGYLAQSSKRLHFGLGDAQRVESVTVHWPGGAQDTYEDLTVDQRYRITQGAAEAEVVRTRERLGLVSKVSAPLEQPADAVVERIPLAERLPIGPLRVPAFDDSGRLVESLAGAHLLLDLFSVDNEDCSLELLRLRRRQDELRKAGVIVVPLCVDEPGRRAGAQEFLRAFELDSLAGYLDEKALKAFEVILSEVIGRSVETPLPTSFLVDESGLLSVVYLGPVRVPQLLKDMAVIEAMPPGELNGERLLGGPWLAPPRRNMERIVNAMGMLGLRDLGRHFFDFEKAR